MVQNLLYTGVEVTVLLVVVHGNGLNVLAIGAKAVAEECVSLGLAPVIRYIGEARRTDQRHEDGSL